MDISSGLVSADWLASNLARPDIAIIDASWYLPHAQRDAYAEYREKHIPGAFFFDLDAVALQGTDLPHMAPPPEQFADAIGAMGITQHHQIVVYDGAGLFSAARLWWLLRLMGHERVSVLDGGLPAWRAQGFELSDKAPNIGAEHYAPQFNPKLCAHYDDVRAAVDNGSAQIVDARSRPRFRGEAPEPRPDLPSGHMPGSMSLPFDELLDGRGYLKPKNQLRAAFQSAGVDFERPIIVSCGSGVTAAVLGFCLSFLGHDDWSLYDGSWAEWASTPQAPILTGGQ